VRSEDASAHSFCCLRQPIDPDSGGFDKCFYQYKETETAYTDDDCAYASNEIAINRNAPVVYLLNALEALSGKLLNQ
jgi:endoglucanase